MIVQHIMTNYSTLRRAHATAVDRRGGVAVDIAFGNGHGFVKCVCADIKVRFAWTCFERFAVGSIVVVAWPVSEYRSGVKGRGHGGVLGGKSASGQRRYSGRRPVSFAFGRQRWEAFVRLSVGRI